MRLTQLPHCRAAMSITERAKGFIKVCTREMSSVRRTPDPRKELQVLNRRGSSRVVLLPKKCSELVSGGKIFGFVLATLLVVGASASASDLTGRVTNGTTKKPAVGDEVVLLTSSNGGMNETARATTHRARHFSLTAGH